MTVQETRSAEPIETFDTFERDTSGVFVGNGASHEALDAALLSFEAKLDKKLNNLLKRRLKTLDDTSKSLTDLGGRLQELETQVHRALALQGGESAREAFGAFQGRLDALQEALRESHPEQELDAIREQLSTLSARLGTLQDAIPQRDETRDALAHAEFRADLEQLKAEAQEMTGRTVEELSLRLDHLRQDFATRTEHLESEIRALSNGSQEIWDLRAALERQANALETLREGVADQLRAVQAATQETLSGLRQNVAEAKAASDSRLGEVGAALVSLTVRAEEYDREVHQALSTHDAAVSRLVDSLRADMGSLRQDIASALRLASDEQNAKLQSALQRLDSMTESARKSASSHSVELESQQAAVRSLEVRLTQLRSMTTYTFWTLIAASLLVVAVVILT